MALLCFIIGLMNSMGAKVQNIMNSKRFHVFRGRDMPEPSFPRKFSPPGYGLIYFMENLLINFRENFHGENLLALPPGGLQRL